MGDGGGGQNWRIKMDGGWWVLEAVELEMGLGLELELELEGGDMLRFYLVEVWNWMG